MSQVRNQLHAHRPPNTILTCSQWHACALQKVTGHVWCWGYNAYMMFGRLAKQYAPNPHTPSSPPSPPQFSRFCSPPIDGYDHVPRRAMFAPAYTTFLSATSLAVGRFHNCALVQHSNVYCWGDNSAGAVSLLNFCTQLHHVQRQTTMPCHASRWPLLL